MASVTEDYKSDEKDDEKKVDDTLMADADMDKITAEIEKQPIVSEQRKLTSLLTEFKDHANFTRQMNALIASEHHSSYRQMRRDGNCFYRAFLLGLFETIENTRDLTLLTTVSEHVMTSLHRSLKFGFEQFTIEDFYYEFMDELQFYQRKLESMRNGSVIYKAQDGHGNTAIERLANPHHAQYLIFWARMLASLHMREHEEDFAPFIPQDSGGFAAWLKSDVEAIKSEADHLQTVALCRAINVPVTIYCLENIEKGGPQKVNTIESSENSCFDLLFRPGHYDVLYRNSVERKTDAQQSTSKNAKLESAAQNTDTQTIAQQTNNNNNNNDKNDTNTDISNNGNVN